MVATGEQGYLDATQRILQSADAIKAGIRQIPELRLLGDPLFVIAFASDVLDIYAVSDYMGKKGWSLNGLQNPPALHIALTVRHSGEDFAQRLVADLREAVAYVNANPGMTGSMTPVYGMTSNVYTKGAVAEFLKGLLDLVFEV
jgi:glutamate/tyrosine decarboxylase-like PLP-dependent enzyme